MIRLPWQDLEIVLDLCADLVLLIGALFETTHADPHGTGESLCVVLAAGPPGLALIPKHRQDFVELFSFPVKMLSY